MILLFVYAITLVLAVLLSAMAHRSILSASVLFLAAGLLSSKVLLDVAPVEPGSPLVYAVTELALVCVLFTDGMKVSLPKLKSAWHLPGRALLLGMPLTFGAIAFFAHGLIGLNFKESLLLAAILSPTDPVFASALVGSEKISHPLRQLLNVESGLNDGLALPVVLTVLAALGMGSGSQQLPLPHVLWGLVWGSVLGMIVPVVVLNLEKLNIFSVSGHYRRLMAFSIGLLTFALAKCLHINEYLAAFFAGVSTASRGPQATSAFAELGESLSELLKLGALLVFGALFSPEFFKDLNIYILLFMGCVLFLARPLALGLSLWGSGLNFKERAVAMWFGPKGFASVVYGLLVLRAHLPQSHQIFHLAGLTIAVSIILHSSSDVPIVKVLERGPQRSIYG